MSIWFISCFLFLFSRFPLTNHTHDGGHEKNLNTISHMSTSRFMHIVALFWFRELSATPHACTLPSTTAMAETQASGNGAVQSSGDAHVMYVNDVLKSRPQRMQLLQPRARKRHGHLFEYLVTSCTHLTIEYCHCNMFGFSWARYWSICSTGILFL